MTMIKDLHLNDDNLKQCIHQNFSQTTEYNIDTNMFATTKASKKKQVNQMPRSQSL